MNPGTLTITAPNPDDFSVNADSTEYTIHTATGWNFFCDALQDNETYNHFSGKTVKLGANITVTQMAGGSNHAFTGTFDGNHKTLTLNYGTAQAPIDAEFVAPFVEVSGGAEFIDLNIDGHIYAAYTGSSEPGVGGLIGHLFGSITIEGCTSTVEINSTKDRVGGFVGLCEHAVTFTNCKSSAVVTCTGSGSGFVGWSRNSDYTIAFYGCLFNGKVLKKNGVGNGNGGFVGWKGYHKTVEITNCLVDPAAVAEGETMADNNSATFCRYSADTSLDNQATTITNCYYTEKFGNAQGTQAYSISGGNYVTVENAGTASSEYNTSCLIFYNVGLKYGDVLYAAENDEVSLTLGNTVPEGYFLSYSVSPTEATLSGSGTTYTLTMPDADVVITANTNFPSVSYIDENGETQQCTDYLWLTGTETTLGTAGQETWCVVQGTLNYSESIQLLGNTHIILCDGAAMNIGTSNNPVSGSSFQEQVGFYGGDITYNLSLYAQSGNTGALTIYSQSCSFYVKDLTIAGGNVNTTSLSSVPVIGCDNLTVRRSSLEVQANYYAAIQANNDVTLSNVTANLNSSNGVGLVCSNFTVDHSQLTVTTRYQAIQASNVITLSNVTANINSSNGVGLDCSNFTVDHSQLTVTARYQAIQASNVITLGCTAATDFIKATCTSSLTDSYYGTVKIADGQTLYAGANAYTGTLTDAQRQVIGGQKLTNVAPPTYDYIGLDGTGATHTAVVIDADNMPTSLSGWYIVQGTVNYTNTINLAGDTHIILADNAVMNVTVGGNHGIRNTSGNNYSLFVYGQTGQSGELNVTSNSYACYIYGGDITIAGGKVTASGTTGIYAQHNNNGGNVTIKNATVTATGTSRYGIFAENGGNITIDNSNVTATSTGNHGIYAENGNITIASGTVTASSTKFGIYTVNGSVTINGGQVTATGNIYGIYAQNSSDNITLGWTNPTDFIYANKYYAGGTLSIAEGKAFIDEAGNTYSGTIAMVSGAYAIDGKTLYPNCVVMKQVAGYGEGNGGWVFIASPVAESIAPSEVHNLFPSAGETSNEYDLYRFNQSSSNGKEWQNWKQDEGHNNVAPGFSLVNGQGYLYASKETRTLVFAGEYTAATGSVEVPLAYDATAQLKGWNLVGNPFTTQATMTNGNGQPVSFYVINGQNVVPNEGSAAIEPCTGVMVKAEGTGEKVRFTSVSPDQAPQPNKGSLQIALSQVTSSLRGTKQSSTLDNAIVSFNEGSKLGKFYFGTQNANIYIPQGNEEYAIAYSNGQGEMPLNFKAEENGTYTISVDVDNVELAYLHLIDNLTGADVDLLVPELVEGPASYTFTANTTDYESRFKLVFAVGSSTDSDTFAFFSNGNWFISNEGHATVQVIDVNGRILSSEQINGSISKAINQPAGLYMLRLINGENVRTQKIVVE